jgi:predicted phosphodiesterase
MKELRRSCRLSAGFLFTCFVVGSFDHSGLFWRLLSPPLTAVSAPESVVEQTARLAPVTVAFLADQGLGPNAVRVLRLVKQQGAQLVVHAGDLDYQNNPTAWDQQITDILGADFPYVATIGNHDVSAWEHYQTKLSQRLARTPNVRCQGDLGVQSTCTYHGVFLVLSGVGTQGFSWRHTAYIRTQLAQTNAPWRLCVWHRNRHALQVENKTNDVPLSNYEVCRLGGAIIITGHSHTYSRTHLLANFQTLHVASTASPVRIALGKSLVIVTGLGGHGARAQRQHGPQWAGIYTKTQGATAGALFCTFYWQSRPDQACCWFQDVHGAVPDACTLVNEIGRTPQARSQGFSPTRRFVRGMGDRKRPLPTERHHSKEARLFPHTAGNMALPRQIFGKNHIPWPDPHHRAIPHFNLRLSR